MRKQSIVDGVAAIGLYSPERRLNKARMSTTGVIPTWRRLSSLRISKSAKNPTLYYLGPELIADALHC